jgi:hypothetical protein
MGKEIWIAIPDSFVSDLSTLRDKTIKVGILARACSIFGIKKIAIYHDEIHGKERDRRIMKRILEYAETPQYLRKELFGKEEELRYVGLLHPLRTPHHKLKANIKEIKRGEIRDALVVKRKGNYYAYVGLDALIPIKGKVKEGQRVTVIFTSEFPNIRCELFKEEPKEYWGYKVLEFQTLVSALNSTNKVILTSRKGYLVNKRLNEIKEILRSKEPLLVAFGSQKRGLLDMLDTDLQRLPKNWYCYNFFPNQQTATIRTEEAVLGVLSIINLINHLG